MTYKKIIFILFVVIITPIHLIYSQDSTNHTSLFLEIFGPGKIYSVNFEGFISDNIAIRIGFSTYSKHYEESTTTFLGSPYTSKAYTTSYFAFPVMVNLVFGNLIIADVCFKLELGVGLEYVNFENDGFYWSLFKTTEYLSSHDQPSIDGLILIGSIGLRCQPLSGRLQHRFSITPMLGPYGHKLYFAFSIGYLF